MKNLKKINAICVTSKEVSRKIITFDTLSGLIVDTNFYNGTENSDYYFSDDCLLFAAMGDIHIHAREDVSKKNIYKEDFQSACCAGINGGVLHIADMPNNPIPPIDDLSYKEKALLTSNHKLPILLYAGIGPTTSPLSFKVPYKVYMGPSIGELYFKTNRELEDVMPKYKGQWVSFHCEDPEILNEHKDASNHYLKRPIQAEVMATKLALSLIKKYDLKGKLCHYSAGAGLDLIKQFKLEGGNVVCEVTPQHLFFTEEMIEEMPFLNRVHFQMNPPIRKKVDADKLLTALKNGDIDLLATDHAPHSEAEKNAGMSGLPGLDTYGPFVTWLIKEKNVCPKIIAKISSENPGQFFNEFLNANQLELNSFKNLGLGLGFLETGFSASFTILNINKPFKITKNNLKTKALWSPFLDYTFPGGVEAVFLKGVKL